MTVWLQNPFDNLPLEGYRSQRYWMLAEAFASAGHEVVCFTSDFSHATKCPRILSGTPPFRLVLLKTPPYAKNVGWARVRSHRVYAREWLRVATDAASRLPRPDLIVSSFPTISAAKTALVLGRRFGAKTVVDVQDAWPETFERLFPRPLRFLAKIAFAPLRRRAKRIFAAADRVTGVCDAYRELTGRADYRRAYLGIGLRPLAPAPARTRPPVRLVYAGGLGRTYDLATLVKAVERNEDFELDVAGFGAFASACSRIRFHGPLGADDLRALFACCDVGLVPMDASSHVGVPNKFFDYSEAGLAIVSSLKGESADLLRTYRCGATYRPGSAASLAAAVREAAALARGASRRMCETEFDASRIYTGLVSFLV